MATIALIGGGGHARSVLDAIQAAGEHDVAGIVDVPERVGETVDGVPVRWTDADLPGLKAQGVDGCVVAIGSVGDSSTRERADLAMSAAGLPLITVVHPSSTVSAAASLGPGAFVAAGAIVGPGSVLGRCAIVNSGAIVDHDCVVGPFAHVAPGATLSGGVTVGSGSHVGTGASVKQGITIGLRTVVGVGAAVVDDLPDGVVAVGVPCRVVRQVGR